MQDEARLVFNRGCCRQIQTEQCKNDRSSCPHWYEELDLRAWKKTQDEIDREIAIMIDDWDKLTEQLGHDVVVAVRRAIWERHGNATEWAV